MFAGFTDRDFDAYQPQKWRSNTFNLERIAVKEKLAHLGRAAGALIGSDAQQLMVELSAEHPALWNHKQVDSQQVFFSRGKEARRQLDTFIDRGRSMASLLEDPSPQRSHIFLFAGVWLDHVRVGLRLHADARIDRENFEKQVADAWYAQTFAEQIRGLPAELTIAVDGGPSLAAPAFEPTTIPALVAALAAPRPPAAPRWLSIGRRLERADAIAAGADLATIARDVLVALMPAYQFIAWTPDNDHISMRDQLRDRTAQIKRRGLARQDKVRVVGGMFAGRTGTVVDIDARGMLKVLLGNVPLKLRADEVEKA
jgi:hypothetical protein